MRLGTELAEYPQAFSGERRDIAKALGEARARALEKPLSGLASREPPGREGVCAGRGGSGVTLEMQIIDTFSWEPERGF